VPDPTITAVTFGCRLNAAESEAARAHAQAAGLRDAVIVNTCAVTGEAVRQARQAIRRARRDRPTARIIVTGCAAQLDPAQFQAMPEVDLVLGNAEKTRIDSFRAARGAAVGDIMAVRAAAPLAADAAQPRQRAIVPVQNGCDHRCTFCIIPHARGPSRSTPAEAVAAHIRRLADMGAPEVVLTGVDLTSWGEDLPGRPRFGDLVARILNDAPALPRLRLSSLDAIEIDAALFALIVNEPRIAPHLHLSLQHGDDLILKRMKRRHSRAEAIDLCKRLKAARPEIALGADLIAGFPTETEAQHEHSVSLIAACDLAFVHVFPFSPRPTTPAARMPQCAPDAIKSRAAALRDAARAALRRHLDGWVGRSAEALVEGGGFARLADFTGVRLTQEAPPRGAKAHLAFAGHDGEALIGSFA
jgi:threonylcarbamoyladenosine tRNA methylthiotransferase MtaB